MFNADTVNKLLSGYRQPAYTSSRNVPENMVRAVIDEKDRLRAALDGYDQIVRVVILALTQDGKSGNVLRGEMAKQLEDALNAACEAAEGK